MNTLTFQKYVLQKKIHFTFLLHEIRISYPQNCENKLIFLYDFSFWNFHLSHMKVS